MQRRQMCVEIKEHRFRNSTLPFGRKRPGGEFLMENGSKMTLNLMHATPPFGSLFATFSEGRLLDAFWSPFNSFLAPFWLPFGSPWLPFGTLWLPFGALWLPFGSLLGPFGLHFLILVDVGTLLAPFCLRFAYFFAFLTPSDSIFDIFRTHLQKIAKLTHALQPPTDFRIHLSLQARGGYIAAGN